MVPDTANEILHSNRFAYIIHSISSSKTENEINLSLTGIYTSSLCANISFEMLSDLIFINIHSTALVRNKTIDVYRVSLDAMAVEIAYVWDLSVRD